MYILKLTLFMTFVLGIPVVLVFGQGAISTALLAAVMVGALLLNTGYMFYLGATRFYFRY